MRRKINIGFLYFTLPLLFFLFIDFSRETDIWFLLSHGRYVISYGLPYTEFLTIHSGFHFIMQQWGFSVLSYFLYSILGSIGIIGFLFIINLLFLFFFYKICMIISDNNIYFSCFISAMMDLLLELNFMIPRPQVVSLLLFSIVLYLLERYSKDSTNKYIYFLPLISVILINIHASMWLILFVICIPYVLEFTYLLFKERDRRLFLLLFLICFSFFLGFLNPYGIEAMTYSLRSYGISSINLLVGEMHSVSFVGNTYITYNSILFVVLFLLELVFFLFNRYRLSIHSCFLFLGFSLMAGMNLRNISLFIIGAMPFFVLFFPKKITSEISIQVTSVFVLIFSLIFFYQYKNHFYVLEDKNMKDVVSFLNTNYSKDIVLFNHFDDGPYLEWNGYSVYIDTRAEVFLRQNNHKEDILDEYYQMLIGTISYEKFIDKYQFSHFITYKDTVIYHYLKEHDEYSIIYRKDNIVLFQRN